MLQFLVVDVVAKLNLDVKTSPDKTCSIYIDSRTSQSQESGHRKQVPRRSSILSNGRGSTALVTLSLRRWPLDALPLRRR
jgi:hypothetical protein